MLLWGATPCGLCMEICLLGLAYQIESKNNEFLYKIFIRMCVH